MPRCRRGRAADKRERWRGDGSAESAVPESKVLLKQALREMSLDDAKRILTGGDDAATQYFKRATYAPLKAKFAPIIARATEKVKLSETYDAVAKKAVALGVLKPDRLPLRLAHEYHEPAVRSREPQLLRVNVAGSVNQ